MKISFTLNQAHALEVSSAVVSEFETLVNAYNLGAVSYSDIVSIKEAGNSYFSVTRYGFRWFGHIEGKLPDGVFDVDRLLFSLSVRTAWADVFVSLQQLKVKQISVSKLARQISELKALLESIEW